MGVGLPIILACAFTLLEEPSTNIAANKKEIGIICFFMVIWFILTTNIPL
jgi:hypothetical protein